MKQLLLCLCSIVYTYGNAQYISTPPTRDGSIGTNEYGNHTNGNNAWNDGSRTWYMAWDATNLYLAVNSNGNATDDELVLYIDTDPALPVVAGTGPNDGTGDFDGKNYGRLPFSANFASYIRNGFHQHRTNSGNSWSSDVNNNGAITKTTTGNIQEIQIAWSLMGGRPSAFNFFMYLNGGSPYGGTSVYNTNNDNDQSNNILNLTARKYFTISSTNNGSSTAPFSQLSYTNSHAGSNTINNYGNSFYDVTLNIGATTTLTAALNVSGHLYINDNDALNMANNAITLQGNITRNQPVGALSNMGVITFNGTADQIQRGNITYNGGLTINKASGKVLLASNGSNAGIVVDNNSTLTLTNGTIDARTNNSLVEIRNGSTITAGGSTSFIDGNLQINNIGVVAKLFPVGRTSYNPATITNIGVLDNFTINVGNYLTLDGTATGINGTDQIVNRTWNVSEATAGGSVVALTLQWNSSTPEELMGFNSNSCHVGHFTGGFWQGGIAGVATAGNIANSLTRTRTNVTSFSPFGVASVGALPLHDNILSAIQNNGYTTLQWQNSTATICNYTIETSTDGITYKKLIDLPYNSNNTVNKYNDYNLYTSKIFYRLAIVNATGAVAYSNVVLINTNRKAAITLVQKQLQITTTNDNATLCINTISGQLLLSKQLTKGITTINLENHCSNKVVVVTLVQNKERISKKIIVE